METTRADVQSKGPFHQELSEADKEIIRRVEKIAKDKKLSMAQVSFLCTPPYHQFISKFADNIWCRTGCAQKVTAPLVGISKAERLQELVDVIKNGTKLSDEGKRSPSPCRTQADSELKKSSIWKSHTSQNRCSDMLERKCRRCRSKACTQKSACLLLCMLFYPPNLPSH